MLQLLHCVLRQPSEVSELSELHQPELASTGVLARKQLQAEYSKSAKLIGAFLTWLAANGSSSSTRSEVDD
jgi:hypothetical protein